MLDFVPGEEFYLPGLQGNQPVAQLWYYLDTCYPRPGITAVRLRRALTGEEMTVKHTKVYKHARDALDRARELFEKG